MTQTLNNGKTKRPTSTPNRSQADLEAACLREMKEHVNFDGPIQCNTSKLIRFSTDKNKSKKDEFYSCRTWEFKGKPYLQCYYGTWSGGFKEYWFKSYEDNDLKHLSQNEYKEFKEDEERREKELNETIEKERQEKIKKAKEMWDKASIDPFHCDHKEYLERKKSLAIGLKYAKDDYGNHVIVMPIQNVDEEIQAIQHTQKSGSKFIHGSKRGNFCPLGTIQNGGEIIVAEGYSTAYSVHAATGISVVVAVDCGNIDPVIHNIKTKYPNLSITIAGDDDVETRDQQTGMLTNPGRRDAEKAAKKYGCAVVFPEFREDFKLPDGSRPTDFNDLHVHFGIDAVKEKLKKRYDQNVEVQEEVKKLSYNLLEKEEPCDCFSLDHLPKQLNDYISSICETTNAHPIMITSSVLATISAFLQKKVFIPEGEFFQTLYTNLWQLNVTKSGQFKSTATNKGAKLALEQSGKVTEQIKIIEAKIRIAKDNDLKPLKEERLTVSLTDVILPNKITTEALLEHLAQGHAGVIFTSEFGAWLQNLEKAHNTDLKAVLTDLYDVPQAYRYKTKTQGDFILEKPCFSICGVSTMSWLKANLKHDDVSSGFFARYLIFAPPHKDEVPPALPRKIIRMDRDPEFKVKKTLEYMDSEYRYVLSPSAKKEFESMHNSLYMMTKSYSDKCKEILEPFLKRWSPYILKLSMIMQLFIDHQSKEIGDEAINSAMAVLLPAIKSTAHLFEGELGESEHQRKCRVVLDWISKKCIERKKPVKWGELISSPPIGRRKQ